MEGLSPSFANTQHFFYSRESDDAFRGGCLDRRGELLRLRAVFCLMRLVDSSGWH
jgi:hypothetical protein